MTKRKVTGNGGADAAARQAQAATVAEEARRGPAPSSKWAEEDRRARAKGPGNRGRGLKASTASDCFAEEDRLFRGGAKGHHGLVPDQVLKKTTVTR